MKKLDIISKSSITIGILILLLIGFACFIAVYFQVFSGKDLWFQMFAAILGVMITAVVTMVLLNGQSKKEIKREKEAKVFEEKLRIYQKYLHTLCEAIKKHQLTDEDRIRLQFQTASIAMHTEPKHIQKISGSISAIIASTCSKEGSRTNVLEHLIDIVSCFHKELYQKEYNPPKKDKQIDISSIAKVFQQVFDSAEDGGSDSELQRLAVDLNISSAVPIILTSSDKREDKKQESAADLTLWENAKKEWESEGWELDLQGSDLSIQNKSQDNPGVIEVLYCNDGFHIGARYSEDNYFSQALKERKKGRRSKGVWWNYLPEPYRDIPENELWEFLKKDKNFLQYFIDTINELIKALTTHHNSIKLKEKFDDCKGKYNLYVWENILACEFENKEKGTPYLDIKEDKEKGKFYIHLSNRIADKNKLEEILNGIKRNNLKIEDDVYVSLEYSSVDDIKSLIKEIDNLIKK